MLDRLREHTEGGAPEIIALMGKLDRGEWNWTGPQPFGWQKSKRKPAASAR